MIAGRLTGTGPELRQVNPPLSTVSTFQGIRLLALVFTGRAGLRPAEPFGQFNAWPGAQALPGIRHRFDPDKEEARP